MYIESVISDLSQKNAVSYIIYCLIHSDRHQTQLKKMDEPRRCPSLDNKHCANDHIHYCDVIMIASASLIISVSIFYLTVASCADQRKHQSSASLAFVRGNSPVTGPVARKMFSFDDVIMAWELLFRTIGLSTLSVWGTRKMPE